MGFGESDLHPEVVSVVVTHRDLALEEGVVLVHDYPGIGIVLIWGIVHLDATTHACCHGHAGRSLTSSAATSLLLVG